MIVIAHLSDIHLDGDEWSLARAARVFDHLNGLRGEIDAVLVTGDLAAHGLAEEYEAVAKLFAGPRKPLHCPGNHDVRGPYREVLLSEAPSDAPINQVHHAGGVVFALCDSTIPGRDDGYLADETLAWLESVLDGAAGAPVFVCFHHPPADCTSRTSTASGSPVRTGWRPCFPATPTWSRSCADTRTQPR